MPAFRAEEPSPGRISLPAFMLLLVLGILVLSVAMIGPKYGAAVMEDVVPKFWP
jgi:hypothetical protein